MSEYKYNELNQPIQEKDPMGNLKTYQYYASYDKRAGMIQKKIRPSGITATYDYNANNEESRVTYRNPTTGASLDNMFACKADGRLALEKLEGDLAGRAQRLVHEWAEKYQTELLHMWDSQEFIQLPGLDWSANMSFG